MAPPKQPEVLEGEIDEYVYECWISGGPDHSGLGEGFCKQEANNVAIWVEEQLTNMLLHQHLHIVQHLKSEYAE